VKLIKLGEIPVGKGFPPVMLPDIDMFFNRDLELAKEIVRKLVGSGVKVIKGAVIHNAEIALDDGTQEVYYSSRTGSIAENYRSLMERKVMTLEEHEELFKLCRSLGPELVLSVYDSCGASFAKDIGACALKVPSTNITHEQLIRFLGKLQIPVIIDTGKSTLEEIARAVQWARDAGINELILEHSPEAPPSSLANHNLRMITSLQKIFECPVGLSDHHAGDEMMFAAVALGASVLEKGVCADDQGVDQDVYHAMRVGEVAGILTKCENIFEALGGHMRYLQRDRPKPKARMGLIARKQLQSGSLINEENIDFAFPARGVPTEYWSLVQGWKIKSGIDQGRTINWEDLEPVAK
jgi:N,N'-diacetyllegionaminate synthase